MLKCDVCGAENAVRYQFTAGSLSDKLDLCKWCFGFISHAGLGESIRISLQMWQGIDEKTIANTAKFEALEQALASEVKAVSYWKNMWKNMVLLTCDEQTRQDRDLLAKWVARHVGRASDTVWPLSDETNAAMQRECQRQAMKQQPSPSPDPIPDPSPDGDELAMNWRGTGEELARNDRKLLAKWVVKNRLNTLQPGFVIAVGNIDVTGMRALGRETQRQEGRRNSSEEAV